MPGASDCLKVGWGFWGLGGFRSLGFRGSGLRDLDFRVLVLLVFWRQVRILFVSSAVAVCPPASLGFRVLGLGFKGLGVQALGVQDFRIRFF